MDTVTNVKKVSLILFLLLTGTHLASALLVAKGYNHMVWVVLYRTLDLPALLAGIVYGGSSLHDYLNALGKNPKSLELVGGIVGSIMLVAALYLNFLY